ncbi:hypothetical protein KCU98_g9216, partial [Aureobasidium melanogenum]
MEANDRPFSCLQCPYRARTHPNMMSHIAIKHAAVKPFACTEHGCAVTCARADYLRDHVHDAHGRLLRPHERTGDAAIIRSIKDEADLTEVAVHPRVPRTAAPLVAPAAPLVAAPLVAAPVAPLVAPPVAPAAPLANIDKDTIPGYYLYFGIPYGTGPPIPGGR